jgi:putative intracellular protease/amidase
MPQSELHQIPRPTRLVVQRLREPEIIPLEVGDLWVDGAVVRERIADWGFAEAVQRALQLLYEGSGATWSNGALLPSVAGFEAVYLAGGLALEGFLGARLEDSRWKTFFGAGGVFASVAGGLGVLADLGLSGWVLDLGQSQLKLASAKHVWTFPRNADRLVRPEDLTCQEVQRRRLRDFLSLKLQIALAETGSRPQALVFALPARLTDDGRPETGDYAGLRGYRELIPDVLESAGLADARAFVVNDAELAAFGARADPRLAEFRKILVLTLGFGIGAALVYRAS